MRVTRVSLVLAICLGFSLAALAAGGGQDVEATPQAKAYRAALKAIAAGDFEAYKKTLSSATLKQMEEQTKGKSSKEVMEFVKMMSPADQKLTSVKVDGKKATLMASGWMKRADSGKSVSRAGNRQSRLPVCHPV
jgi:hypothetical protein